MELNECQFAFSAALIRLLSMFQLGSVFLALVLINEGGYREFATY